MPTSELPVEMPRTFIKTESPFIPPAASYFKSARSLFATSARRSTLPDFFCKVGGSTFRLRFANGSLKRMVVAALTHLETDPVAEPRLTICLGDLTAAGASLEFPGGKPGGSEPPGTLWRHEAEDFFMLAQNDAGILSLADWKANEAFYWVRSAEKLPWFEGGFPLRHIFAAFFQRQGRHLIHAAAVGDAEGAVLIIGKGGSGKSTTALACAASGLLYLGDDYTLLGVEPEPRVWSLYASAKATASTLRLFPGLKSRVQHDGGVADKSLLLLNGAKGFQLTASLPVRAVVWPFVTGKPETNLRPASPATLLLAVAPSTIFQMPGDAAASFDALARLVRSVPTFILEAGSEMSGLAAIIKKLLAR